MDLKALQRYCLSLPGTTEDLKWENDLCFCVGDKMYGVLGLEKDKPPKFCFKTTPELYEQFIQLPNIVSAPYVGRFKWVLLERLDALPEAQLKQMISDSYHMIFSKLPKKKRTAILAASKKQN